VHIRCVQIDRPIRFSPVPQFRAQRTQGIYR